MMHLNKIFRPSVGANLCPHTHHPKMPPMRVTLSRSEESVALGIEMLRFAQHDMAVYFPRNRSRNCECRFVTSSPTIAYRSGESPANLLLKGVDYSLTLAQLLH